MAISTLDGLVNATANNSTRFIIDKVSIASQAVGNYVSMWRATGQPAQGAIPTTAEVLNNTTVGGINFTQQTAPATSYLAWLNLNSNAATQTPEIHDRLMHMGGLVGNVATAQTVNLDLHANLATSNLDARKGDANYSDVQWWMEWYTATGSTAVTATIAVTYDDGTSGNLSTLSLAATRPASLMIPLNSLVPSASAGKYIRDIDTVTLSATTGTAGNFGFTATRYRTGLPLLLANKAETGDWAQLGLSEVYNSSCLFPVILTTTTASGTLKGTGKIAHG